MSLWPNPSTPRTGRSHTATPYPCDRGTGTPLGYHHYQAGPTRTVACIYCGKKATP